VEGDVPQGRASQHPRTPGARAAPQNTALEFLPLLALTEWTVTSMRGGGRRVGGGGGETAVNKQKI
jgi:hypothetical protein